MCIAFFGFDARYVGGRRKWCNACMNAANIGYRKKDPQRFVLVRTKASAKRLGVPFNLTYGDLPIPEVCPLLGIPLVMFGGKITANSASVDRKDPSKGYVKGNVWVISYKANSMKQNASLEDLETLVRNLRVLS